MDNACMGGNRSTYRVLVGNPEGKRPLERPTYRREDNVKMNLKGKGLEGVEWIHLAQDRDQWWDLVNMVKNLQVPLSACNLYNS
jgi:hypothetical protein